MKDIVAGTIISIILFTILARVIVERDFKLKQRQVDEVVYTYTQIASKKGTLTEAMYNEMKGKLNLFGSFFINLRAEKFIEGSDYPLIIEGEKGIVDLDLREEGFDILTITVEAKNEHMLNIFFNSDRVIYKLNGRAAAGIF